MGRLVSVLSAAARTVLRTGRAPLSLTCVLTNRCNHRCPYCDIRDSPAKEMDTDSWAEVLRAFRSLGLVRASFTGGEALLREDLPDLLRLARALGISTSLNTNGWLLPDRWPEIAPHLDMLVVSLDGPEEVHEARSGVRGSHRRVLESLRLASRSRIPAATITVLDRETPPHLPWILRTARRIGFSVYVQPRHGSCLRVDLGLADLDAGSLRTGADVLEAHRRWGFPVGSSRAFLRALRSGRPPYDGCRNCAAGRFFATLLPDGELIPCHLTRHLADRRLVEDIHPVATWETLVPPTAGPGCLIAPYQEMNLLFHLEPTALLAAARRFRWSSLLGTARGAPAFEPWKDVP